MGLGLESVFFFFFPIKQLVPLTRAGRHVLDDLMSLLPGS